MANPNSSDFWQSVYAAGRAPWDLGGPTPVFERLAGEYPAGRLMVLGAGRGWDARMFARHGFEVTAVDFAPGAVADMNHLAEDDAPVEILQADIFALPENMTARFDYLVEYTCFCAIDPARRDEYADLVARLLAPGGHYMALAFPIGDHQGGPPFAVTPEAYIDRLLARGFDLIQRGPDPDSIKPRRGQEELLVMKRGVWNEGGRRSKVS